MARALCRANNWDRHETEQEIDGGLTEAEEMALAARPLEIADELEFEQYFGDLTARRSDQQEVLQELYESPEVLNEGLLSFAYPLFIADGEELDYFLGKLIRSAGKAIGGIAKTIGKGVSAIDKVVPVSCAQHWSRCLGHARLIKMDGNHMLDLEHPAELTTAVSDFITSCAA